jgi:hypothetical protein
MEAAPAERRSGGTAKVITVSCRSTEPDTACAERAEREALAGAPKGAKPIGSPVVISGRARVLVEGFDPAPSTESKPRALLRIKAEREIPAVLSYVQQHATAARVEVVSFTPKDGQIEIVVSCPEPK